MSDAYGEVSIATRADWRRWLAEHHADEPGVWVITHKQGSGRPHVAYDDIVEEALAHGWVDSRPRRVDDGRSALLVTPRKPTSRWSRVNKRRVERLVAAGLMTPAGLAVVEAARTGGTWNALDDVEELREPDDLRAALDGDADARRFWDAFPRSTKRSILEWITAARTDATRGKRVAETARLAAQDVRAHQWRQPKRAGAAAQAPPKRGR